MNVTTVRETKPDPLRDFIAECCGDCDIVPLDQLSAPLVKKMQDAIRRQNAMLKDAASAIQYLLSRKLNFRRDMYGTETEARLTDVLADILRVPRAHVATELCCFHRSENEEEA
jgi:hypothetical protein